MDRFLAEAAAAKPPATRATQRLIFAIDATASRQPTWDLACELHSELFIEATRLGNIAIQLCHYRGFNEFTASRWTTTATELHDQMTAVQCRGGRTQLHRLLEHAVAEASRHPVRALVFIGDCFEEDEADVVRVAGQLRMRQLPVFLFQEGADRAATAAFGAVAKITGGAHVSFDRHSPDELRRLLGAVAQFAVGGLDALTDYTRRNSNGQTQLLLTQLRPR